MSGRSRGKAIQKTPAPRARRHAASAGSAVHKPVRPARSAPPRTPPRTPNGTATNHQPERSNGTDELIAARRAYDAAQATLRAAEEKAAADRACNQPTALTTHEHDEEEEDDDDEVECDESEEEEAHADDTVEQVAIGPGGGLCGSDQARARAIL